MTWNHPALAQRALDEGDQQIKRLRARIEQLEAAIKFWSMARYPEKHPDPHDMEGRCQAQAAIDMAETTLWNLARAISSITKTTEG